MRLVGVLVMIAGGVSALAQGFDVRGPVAGAVGHVVVTESGVEAKPELMKLPPDLGTWKPDWIWVQGAGSGLAGQFRKDLVLPDRAQVTRALVRVSADRNLRLWVNGRLVLRGPDDAGSDVILYKNWSHQWLYNVVDIAPYLEVGRNEIAAEVFTGGPIVGFSLGHPGFALQAEIEVTGMSPLTLHTGPDWEARMATTYAADTIVGADGKPVGKGLIYDAQKDDLGWQVELGGWAKAQPVESAWGELVASRIPPAMEAVWPVKEVTGTTAGVKVEVDGRVRLDGDGSFLLEYGRMLSAHVSLKVQGPAGTVVVLRPQELRGGGARRPVRITLGPRESAFESPMLDAFSVVRVEVMGATGPVEFSSMGAIFQSQPVAYRGQFESSDEGLNRLWRAARWADEICMQDRYLDSPNHQEPLGDVGDYLIESQMADYAFGAQPLTRQDLRKFAAMLDHNGEVNFHTSYALLWVQMLMQEYQWTGDEALVRELKPTVDRLMEHFSGFRGANGLLSEAPNYMFMDWGTIAGFPGHHPPAVIGQGYLTAFYYAALGDAQRIAELTGDAGGSKHYAELRGEIKESFERELWDEKAGLYRDGKPRQNHQPLNNWLPADTNIETHTPQVNALAVLYDLAPKERQPAVMETVLKESPLSVQPYYMHFMFAAEDHAGIYGEVAAQQLRRWVVNPETESLHEEWTAGDWSHAWVGTPLVQLSQHVLGVAPLEPGFKRFAVKPELLGLEWASGVVPSPLGDIAVSWTWRNHVFRLEVRVPPGSGAEVLLPMLSVTNTALHVDGVRVVLGPIRLGPGNHVVQVRR